MKLPHGYHVEWGGQFENLQRAAAAGHHPAGDHRDHFHAAVLCVPLNVPFSLVGGIVALWLRGINLSVSAAVGFISLFGVAVMSGVLVIAEINRRRDAGATVETAVAEGAMAVLMMIVVALGMMPAALGGGIVGGLVSTLVLTLVALPLLYSRAARRRETAA